MKVRRYSRLGMRQAAERKLGMKVTMPRLRGRAVAWAAAWVRLSDAEAVSRVGVLRLGSWIKAVAGERGAVSRVGVLSWIKAVAGERGAVSRVGVLRFGSWIQARERGAVAQQG